jgi:O-antigen/teichoic acid export membrane protein
MIFALPVSGGGYVLAEPLITNLFTNQYQPAVLALKTIIWVVPLMFASEFFGYVVLISGKEANAARAILVSTSVNVLANLILVPQFGLNAAAAMTVFTEIVLVCQYIWTIRKTVALFSFKQTLVLPACAAITMGLLAILLQPWVPLLVNIVACVLCYGVLLFVYRVFGKRTIIENILEFKALLLSIRKQ